MSLSRIADQRLKLPPLTPLSGNTTYPGPPTEVSVEDEDMNAPPRIDPVPANASDEVVHWLTNDTRDERFIDNIFAEM